jgi:hypothetical protein
MNTPNIPLTAQNQGACLSTHADEPHGRGKASPEHQAGWEKHRNRDLDRECSK